MHTLTSAGRRLVTLLLVVLTAVAATAVTAAPANARAGYGSYIVLVPGDHSSRVVTLQRYLHVRPTSGYFGPITRRAVIRWQGAHGRRQTGLVGKKLWRAARSWSNRTPAPSRSGARASGLNWSALARCESGGNPRAVNPRGYYGLYQFSRPTWRWVGGYGSPARASSREQTARARILFSRSGSSPWPTCGRHLFD